jgi:hypothetical protein
MLEKIYRHEENSILEEMEGEALIYNPSASITLHLNPPSVMIWKLLDGERSVQDLVDMLVEAFPEQAEQIEKDVLDTVTDMVNQRVIVEQ